MVTYEDAMARLMSMASPKHLEGMKRYGIAGKNMLGVSIYDIRKLAKEMGRDHALSLRLWDSGIHEARHLAVYTDEADKVTEAQMEAWARDFDSWDICDQACTDLFDRTALAWRKAREWTSRKEEFVKRAGFALIAGLTVHDKKASDGDFKSLLPLIAGEADDERNFVKKAVNWALRNIGKRNAELNTMAIRTAEELEKRKSKSARWIAKDALRELKSENVRKRLSRGK